MTAKWATVRSSLNFYNLDNQSAIHFAKRLNQVEFFSALTNGANMDSITLPPNREEVTYARHQERQAKERKRQAEIVAENTKKIQQKLDQEKSRMDSLLTQALEYILKNEFIEKSVTDENKAHFISTAIGLLEQSDKFQIFKNRVLDTKDYNLEFYVQFKKEVSPFIRDLKIRLNPTQIIFEQMELRIMFDKTVNACEKTLVQQDAAIKAHEATLTAQNTAIKAHQTTIETQKGLLAAAQHSTLYSSPGSNRDHTRDDIKTAVRAAEVGVKVAGLFI